MVSLRFGCQDENQKTGGVRWKYLCENQTTTHGINVNFLHRFVLPRSPVLALSKYSSVNLCWNSDCCLVFPIIFKSKLNRRSHLFIFQWGKTTHIGARERERKREGELNSGEILWLCAYQNNFDQNLMLMSTI